MECRVTIRWTETAANALRSLPSAVRSGMIRKVDALAKCDPRELYKPLVGTLQGYRSIKYSRYRVLFSTETKDLAGGDILVHVIVNVVLVGIRKARDKKDVYEVAKKLVALGIIRPIDPRSKPE